MSYRIGKVTITVVTLIPNETIKQGFQMNLQNLVLFTTLAFTNNVLHYCNVCSPAGWVLQHFNNNNTVYPEIKLRPSSVFKSCHQPTLLGGNILYPDSKVFSHDWKLVLFITST